MNIAKKTYGFALVEKKKVAEINSVARLFRHDSGAELLHIENDDDNKKMIEQTVDEFKQSN